LRKFSVHPAARAEIKAETGLATVIRGSSRAQVMEMESTPDSGVEIRKAVVAPLFAPCFLSEAAAGKTPQEQRGRGIPSRAAFKTELKRPLPRWAATYAGERNILSMPPTRSPKIIYIEDCCSISQQLLMTLKIKSSIISLL
jgi:hypothetical protein